MDVAALVQQMGLVVTVNLVGAVVSILLLIFMASRLRREARATARAPLTAMVSTTVITLIYIALSGTPLNWTTGSAFLGLGVLLGLAQGRASRLSYQGQVLVVKRDTRYLLLWGLAYLVSVLLPLLGSRILHAGGLMALLFGLGVAVGANLMLLLRQAMKRPPGLVSAA